MRRRDLCSITINCVIKVSYDSLIMRNPLTIERVIGSMLVMWLMMLFSACANKNKLAYCGDGVVTFPETCDTLIPEGQPGACPTNCGSGNACVLGALWNAGTCTAMCTQAQVLPCCGNKLLERSEICETSFPEGTTGACPKSCNDGKVCTRDTLENAGTCTDRCIYTPITDCGNGDGCCPLGGNCTSNNDSDCACVCGNGVVEPGCCEQCDPPSGTTCDANCHDDTLIDITGTWIARLKTTGTIDVFSIFGKLTGGTIDVVQRIVVTKSGSSLNMKFDICSLSTFTLGAITLSIDYSAVLKLFTTTATQQDLCMLVDDSVTLPAFNIISGWNGVVPQTNNCPDPLTCNPNPECFHVTSCGPGAIDSDNDGIYGITLPIIIGVQDPFYEYDGITIKTELNQIRLKDPATMTANVDFSIMGYIFGYLTWGATGNMSIIPDSAVVPVTFVKLVGDVSCSEILQNHCPPDSPCTP
jgi:hypothetical protein